MNSKHKLIIAGAATFAPLLALADADPARPDASNALLSFLYSVLPIIVIGGLIWFFFRRVVRKQQQRSDNYVANQARHNERVEQFLERIANALERKDDGRS